MENQQTSVQGQEAQSTSQPATQTSQTTETKDWQKEYEGIQAKLTETQQSLADKQRLLELVDWNGNQQGQQQSQQAYQPQYQQQDEPVTVKTLQGALGEREKVIDAKLGVLSFRQKHPDLVPYENTLMIGMLENIRRKTGGRKPMDEMLDDAAKELRTTLETERKRGADEAISKQKQAASTAGIGSAGSTTPKPDDKGDTNDDYIKHRTELRRKHAG
jgi:hypothetical protein